MGISGRLVGDESSRDDVQVEAASGVAARQISAQTDDIVADVGAVVQVKVGQAGHPREGLADFPVNDDPVKFEVRQVGQAGDALPH